MWSAFALWSHGLWTHNTPSDEKFSTTSTAKISSVILQRIKSYTEWICLQEISIYVLALCDNRLRWQIHLGLFILWSWAAFYLQPKREEKDFGELKMEQKVEVNANQFRLSSWIREDWLNFTCKQAVTDFSYNISLNTPWGYLNCSRDQNNATTAIPRVIFFTSIPADLIAFSSTCQMLMPSCMTNCICSNYETVHFVLLIRCRVSCDESHSTRILRPIRGRLFASSYLMVSATRVYVTARLGHHHVACVSVFILVFAYGWTYV